LRTAKHLQEEVMEIAKRMLFVAALLFGSARGAAADSLFYTGLYDGHEYASYQAPNLSWDEAKANVEAMGPGWYLATATSSGENAFVASLLYNPEVDAGTWIYEAWLGGYQDPPATADPAVNWFWVTGEEFYDNPGFPPHWYAGEPNDWEGGQEANLAMFWNGEWNDATVSASPDITGYVAERVVPEPSVILLLASGAAAWVACRMRRLQGHSLTFLPGYRAA
jgi:hypothetical protein